MTWSEKERAAAKEMFESDPAFKDAQGNQKWTWDDVPCDDIDPRRYWLKKARAALDAADAVDGDAQNGKIRDAFMAGFWAWNGPSNEAELERDMKMEDLAWAGYEADIRSLKRG
jgi:hypothetical protein